MDVNCIHVKERWGKGRVVGGVLLCGQRNSHNQLQQGVVACMLLLRKLVLFLAVLRGQYRRSNRMACLAKHFWKAPSGKTSFFLFF